LSSNNPGLHEIVSSVDASLRSPVKKIKEGDREFELLSVDERIKLAGRINGKKFTAVRMSRGRNL